MLLSFLPIPFTESAWRLQHVANAWVRISDHSQIIIYVNNRIDSDNDKGWYKHGNQSFKSNFKHSVFCFSFCSHHKMNKPSNNAPHCVIDNVNIRESSNAVEYLKKNKNKQGRSPRIHKICALFRFRRTRFRTTRPLAGCNLHPAFLSVFQIKNNVVTRLYPL